jgi:hypothetical protein
LKLSYGRVKNPEQIEDRHLKELKIALDLKTVELAVMKNAKRQRSI